LGELIDNSDASAGFSDSARKSAAKCSKAASDGDDMLLKVDR
jgi:hypothetical protein